jgi:hypothetical protein
MTSQCYADPGLAGAIIRSATVARKAALIRGIAPRR